ncbi:MAG: hypothetical protein Q3959_05815 [Limosilactobacillus sp.]|uniref:5-methylcytosine restriction system specificity protein McrC n=1 Tax=Limosilactobacillus sp. TaxID=2773925 RepID=UPI0027009E87|nr:hypothetical protein [Limosilactobacillus sp.]
MKTRYLDDNSKFDNLELHIEKDILGKTLKELENDGVFVFPNSIFESRDIEDDQMILRQCDSGYRTTNIMGFIGNGNETLFIKSRFSNDNEDYFTQYLMEKVIDVPNLVDLKVSTGINERIFGLLSFTFVIYLKRAIRKGLFKTYVRREFNDRNVKGSIDIARDIKLNVPFMGKVAYSTREYSYDNYLMNLIRYTIEFIRSKKYGRKLLLKAKEEVRRVIYATPSYQDKTVQDLIHENRSKTIHHAYYSEYRDLQKLCILILQHQKQQFGVGSHYTFGILFDGSWLWEEYIGSLIKDGFYHTHNRDKDGQQYLFSGNVGRIYPDFISKDSNNRVIADTKYKPQRNINGRDYLQLLSYMYRFESKTGIYIYPKKQDEKDDKVLYLNRGLSFENSVKFRDDVKLTKLGFDVPNSSSSYEDFCKEVSKSENDFVKYIKYID